MPAFVLASGSPAMRLVGPFTASIGLSSMRSVAATAVPIRAVPSGSPARAVVMPGTLLVAAATRRGVADRRMAARFADAGLAVARPPTALTPVVADLPAADCPAADFPTADLPAADIPAADLPAADVVPLDDAVPRCDAVAGVARPESAVARAGVPERFVVFWGSGRGLFGSGHQGVPPCE